MNAAVSVMMWVLGNMPFWKMLLYSLAQVQHSFHLIADFDFRRREHS